MCTYSQLKKNNDKICVTSPPPPPLPHLCGGLEGVNGMYVPKLYASSGIDISKCIEGGSMKLTTLVDYIYVCAVTNAFPCNECNLFLCIIVFYLFFLNHFCGGFN